MATVTVMLDLKRLGDVRAPAGFAERVLANVGMADSYAVFETVLGRVYVAWNRLGVSAAMRSKSAAEFEDWFRNEIGRQLIRVDPPADLAAKIEDQLEGRRRLRFDLRGLTPFSQAVLHKTLEISRGQVRPYSWIAREIGHPAAVRAVGTALANNPIPYFIPCHRVIRSDGVIGNYGGGGPEAKRERRAALVEAVRPRQTAVEVDRLAVVVGRGHRSAVRPVAEDHSPAARELEPPFESEQLGVEDVWTAEQVPQLLLALVHQQLVGAPVDCGDDF